jgi:hypothetical protein
MECFLTQFPDHPKSTQTILDETDKNQMVLST